MNQGVYILDGYVPLMNFRDYFSSVKKYFFQEGFERFEKGLGKILGFAHKK